MEEKNLFRIYKIERTDEVDYDEYRGFVVIACCINHALKIAERKGGHKGNWAIALIGKATNGMNIIFEDGIILKDYKAGQKGVGLWER